MKKSTYILIIFIILVILDALTDSLFFQGMKFGSKIIENVYKIGLFIVPIFYVRGFKLKDILYLGLLYWFLHITLFDISFNLISGFYANYVGTTSGYYDVIMYKLSTWQFYILKVWFLILAYIIFIKKVRDEKY